MEVDYQRPPNLPRGQRVRVRLSGECTHRYPHVADEDGHVGTVMWVNEYAGDQGHTHMVWFDDPVRPFLLRLTGRVYAPSELEVLPMPANWREELRAYRPFVANGVAQFAVLDRWRWFCTDPETAS